MTGKLGPISSLVLLQRIAWYFFFVYFLFVVVLVAAGAHAAEQLAFWGVVLLLVTTVLQLVFLAEQFRLAGRPRFRALSYLLVLLLFSVVLLKYFVL
jgi:hypothetical protein